MFYLCHVKWFARIISLSAVFISFIVAGSILLTSVHPDPDIVAAYDYSGDDIE